MSDDGLSVVESIQYAFVCAVPPAPENDTAFFSDCELLLGSLIIVALSDGEVSQRDIVEALRKCGGGFGCWLDIFEKALWEMPLDFLPDPDATRAALDGAFRMAKVMLWHIHLGGRVH